MTWTTCSGCCAASSGATRGVVRDTGQVFEAISERQGQLRGLIENSNRVFETTAARDRQLADTFVAFPTFLREARATTRRLTEFARDTDPLVTQLRPAARQLSPTLRELDALAPDLRGLIRDLGPLVTVSRRGLPALERTAGRHQAVPGPARAVPAHVAADPRLPRPLQARDRSLLRQRHGGDRRGGPEHGLVRRPQVPAHDEPAEPRDPGRLRPPHPYESLQPVHGARCL